MNDEQWISPDGTFDPDSFDGLPVTVKARFGGESKGLLTIEGKNDKGQIRIVASYNSSPFGNTQVLEKFHLTQEQLDEFQIKGASCVLVAPPKNPN